MSSSKRVHSGVSTALRMCYNGYGYPLTLFLEEGGVVTVCKINTQEPEEPLDFDFCSTNVTNKVILQSDSLKEAFSELDMTSEILQLTMSPSHPYFRLSTFGNSGNAHYDYPKDSDMMELFQCTKTQTNSCRGNAVSGQSGADERELLENSHACAFHTPTLSTVNAPSLAMARPQPDSRVDNQSPAQHHTCRMEVLRRDARPNGGTQQILQSRRRRTVATQTCSAAAPVISTQDTANTDGSPQQEDPLRDNSGTEQERLYPSRRQQPLPDLLPESSSSSAQSSRRGSVADEESVAEEQVVGRVAVQLRTIGDEINAVYLQRRNEGAHWQNWRGLYRGLVVFLADTISTLYQLR
ncbi:Cell cycle checkpoint protein RAD1 [Bagarius yarrelli]|uniref:Cell cycle checkpoint protein RAD1 n=1 Tax=Bagarius yarrelli TaxID=175774 RepID=A0A556U6Y4_BAGYA|nr:Cell cycle checkpoint protein RAD1 [Bagarius yarrelli]